MNSENQSLIIKIIGATLILILLGTILITITTKDTQLTTVFIGIITTLVGILATALTGKTMTEKQEETLREYHIQHANKEDTPLNIDETEIVPETIE